MLQPTFHYPEIRFEVVEMGGETPDEYFQLTPGLKEFKKLSEEQNLLGPINKIEEEKGR